MGFVFLNRRISEQADIVVNVEVEQRSGLAARLVHEEIVERVVLLMLIKNSVNNQALRSLSLRAE